MKQITQETVRNVADEVSSQISTKQNRRYEQLENNINIMRQNLIQGNKNYNILLTRF